jgi:hypothetical protein
VRGLVIGCLASASWPHSGGAPTEAAAARGDTTVAREATRWLKEVAAQADNGVAQGRRRPVGAAIGIMVAMPTRGRGGNWGKKGLDRWGLRREAMADRQDRERMGPRRQRHCAGFAGQVGRNRVGRIWVRPVKNKQTISKMDKVFFLSPQNRN